MMKWSELSEQERDRLVNTKVMGNPEFCDGNVVVTPANYSSSPMSSSYVVWVCAKCNMMGTCDTKQEVPIQHVSKDIPSYSTDMNAAMSALLHLGKWFKLVYDPGGRQGYKYLCLITIDARCDVSGWSDNPIWAMNLATIKTAVEIEP